MELIIKYGLPFVTIQVKLGTEHLEIPNVLIDTGSAKSIANRTSRSFLSGRLPGYAVPDRVRLVAVIERTPSGKIRRHS